jgi:hypothetical protein
MPFSRDPKNALADMRQFGRVADDVVSAAVAVSTRLLEAQLRPARGGAQIGGALPAPRRGVSRAAVIAGANDLDREPGRARRPAAVARGAERRMITF